MQIRTFGFEWHLGKGINLHEFLTYLQTLSGQIIPDKVPSDEKQEESIKDIAHRVITVTQKAGYWVGVFLTIKNIKAFCQIINKGDSFKITPLSLEDNSNIVDFNFFLIHPLHGRGLYQYYHQSASANTFSYFCKRQYNELKKALIQKEIQQNNEDNLSDRAKKKINKEINKKYDGSLRYSTIICNESLSQFVMGMKDIQSLTFEFVTFDVREQLFSPIKGVSSRIKHEVMFIRNNITGVKDAIVQLISNFPLKYGKVKGVDPLGHDVTYKLNNNYSSFAYNDYDQLVKTVELDSTNLLDSVSNSYIINELIAIANRYKSILTLKTE